MTRFPPGGYPVCHYTTRVAAMAKARRLRRQGVAVLGVVCAQVPLAGAVYVVVGQWKPRR